MMLSKVQTTIMLCICIVAMLSVGGCKSKTEKVMDEDRLAADSLVAVDALYYNFLASDVEQGYRQCLSLNLPSFNTGDYRGVLDAKIDKPKVIAEIQQLVASLVSDDDEKSILPNTRIVVYLRYNSGRRDSLSIGNDERLDRIFVNNRLQKDNKRLLYLIKNNIGLYPWLIGKGLDGQAELYDPSFMKEPFIESKYYKAYSERY